MEISQDSRKQGQSEVDSQLTADNYTFIVSEFVYFYFAVTSKNYVDLEKDQAREILLLAAVANTNLSLKIKLMIHRSLILPVLFRGVKAWMLWRTD